MDVERIESVKLLKTLKGTDENGQLITWLAGTEFKEKPFPKSIMLELQQKRKGGPIIETFYKPDSLPKVKTKPVEESPEVTPDDSPDEKPKEAPPTKLKRRAIKK